MSKKLIAIASLLVVFIVVPIFLYFYFTPKSINSMALTRDKISEHSYADYFKDIKQHQGKRLLYVKDSNVDNSYLEAGILYSVLDEYEGDNLSVEMQILDTSNEKDLTVTQLKDRLSIETTPALVLIEVTGTKINVLNTLVYHEEEPFTKETFKKWLFEQGIWDGPYLESSEL